MPINKRKRVGVKAFLVLISFFIFLLIFPPSAFAAALGDVNGDGEINVQDVVLVMRHVIELETLTLAQQALADVNGDGVVNVQDVTLIMQKALKLIDDFPAGPLAVSSVKADNLREIEITFNRVLTAEQKAEAVKFANYRVYRQGDMAANIFTSGNNAGVKVLEDNRTVRLTLKDNQMLVNHTTANKIVVRKAIGLQTDYEKTDLSVSDTTVPVVESVKVTGPRNLVVSFSEPVVGVAPERFTISGGDYLVSAAELVAKSPRQVAVTAGVNIAEGAQTIYVGATSGLQDHAGYGVVPRVLSFTMVRDTTIPELSVVSATPGEVVIKFNKPVNNVTSANVRYRHTFNTSQYQLLGNQVNFITALADNSYRLSFGAFDKPLSPGDNMLFIGYVLDTGLKITDNWGNVFPASAIPLKVVMDTVRPVVNEVEFVNAQQIRVKFNKEVDPVTSQNINNYTVRNAAGTSIPVLSATRGAGENSHIVTLGFAADALSEVSYTINIKNVRDTAFIPNTMQEVTIPFTAVDTVRPTAGGTAYFSAATKRVLITFSEPMRTSGDGSIADKSNFFYTPHLGTERVLGVNDLLTVGPDAKSVILTISTTVLQSADTIKVYGVRDVAGNILQGFTKEYTGASLVAETVNVEKVEAIDTNRIKVTFDRQLSSVTAQGFKLHKVDGPDTGIGLAVSTHGTVTVGGVKKSVVEFILGANLNHNATYGAAEDRLQLVVSSATGTRSQLGNTVNDIAALPSPPARPNDVRDLIAPVVDRIVRVSATKIEVHLKEDIRETSMAPAGVNGFSVSGGGATLSQAVYIAPRVIELTGTNYTTSTNVSYNEAAGITDSAGNKLASFNWTSTLSTP